jgi:hypothetical protein
VGVDQTLAFAEIAGDILLTARPGDGGDPSRVGEFPGGFGRAAWVPAFAGMSGVN